MVRNGMRSLHNRNPVVKPEGVALPYPFRVRFWISLSIWSCCLLPLMCNRSRATRLYESRIGMMIFSMVSPILGTGIRFGL
jgi:hypothetical protein